MTSEIRTNSLTSRAGLSTVTLTDSGPMFSGITTFVDNSTFSVGTGGTIHAPATNVMALGTNNIDAIKIDSSGNVNISGILTASSISGGVSLAAGANNRIVTATGAAALTGEADLVWDGSRMGVLNQAPQNQYFNTLVVGNNSAGDKGITIRTNNTSKGVLAFSDTDSADSNRYDGYIAYEHNNQAMVLYTGGANERLRIHSNGKISTGVNNNSYELTIGGLSGGPTLWLRDSGTSGAPRILFGSTAGALIGAVTYNNSSNHMEFATNGVEKLRIASNSQLLHTRTDNVQRYDLEFRNTGGIGDGNYGGIHWTQGASGTTNLAAIEIAYANNGRPDIVFKNRQSGGTSISEALRIDSSGRLGIQGAPTRALLEVRASGGSNTMLTALWGANEGTTAGTLSDNTDKAVRMGIHHYDTDALPYALLVGASTNGANNLTFGGGTSLMNAATEIKFNTAANQTTTSGTTRLLITSDGDLVLGSTSSLGRLTISKVQNNLSSAGGFANPHLRLNATSTTNTNGFTGVAYSVSTLTNYGWTAGAQRVSGGGTDGAFIFRHHSNSATGNERFRMKSTGDVEIRSDTGNNLLTLIPTASASTSIVLNSWADSTNSRHFAIRNRYSDHGRLEIMRSTTNSSVPLTAVISFDKYGNIGAPSGTNIYNASDVRLKKNVTTLDKGLESIKSLRPVSFNWIDGFCDNEKETLYGFIAQEVETVDSNLIEKFGNGSVEIGDTAINDTLRVREKHIIAILVKAIQELTTKVETLEAKVAALEGS